MVKVECVRQAMTIKLFQQMRYEGSGVVGDVSRVKRTELHSAIRSGQRYHPADPVYSPLNRHVQVVSVPSLYLRQIKGGVIEHHAANTCC